MQVYHAFLFFNLAACSGKYSLLPVSCNRRFGGGAIVETLKTNIHMRLHI